MEGNSDRSSDYKLQPWWTSAPIRHIPHVLQWLSGAKETAACFTPAALKRSLLYHLLYKIIPVTSALSFEVKALTSASVCRHILFHFELPVCSSLCSNQNHFNRYGPNVQQFIFVTLEQKDPHVLIKNSELWISPDKLSFFLSAPKESC